MMITWGGLQDELAKRLPGLAVVAHACGVIAFLVAGPSSWLRVQEACGPGGAVSRADSVGSRPRSILGAC
jgi:hypothetical protein